MTVFRLGYVAMSVHLQNASPSQTMTYRHFSAIKDKEAALKKLERISISNLQNCLRLLKHNAINNIHFFRLSSKLIPLANHPDLPDWEYMLPLKPTLLEIGEFAQQHHMRIDFHPDHFVVLNSPDKDILKVSLKTLQMHERLLKGMRIDTEHRCVLHVGGVYHDKEQALEQFIANWGLIPVKWQRMIMLENDDTSFTLNDALYLCEKLSIPCVFDLHHHNVHNEGESWEDQWERIVKTWSTSSLPLKMHISSPRTDEKDRSHADYINSEQFLAFLRKVNGSVPQMDCMIEAKKKDDALFELVKDLKKRKSIIFLDESSFQLKE